MAAGWIERVWVGCHLLVSFQALCRHLTLPKSLMLGKMGTNNVLDSFSYPAADPSSPGVTYQPFPVCDVLRQNWFQQHIKGNILQASGDWAEGSGYGIACGSCWFLKSTLVRIQLAWKATLLSSHNQSSEKNKQTIDAGLTATERRFESMLTTSTMTCQVISGICLIHMCTHLHQFNASKLILAMVSTGTLIITPTVTEKELRWFS